MSRAEGAISQEGDAFSAANMNDLEQRISNGFEGVSVKIIPVAFLSIMKNTHARLYQSGAHFAGQLIATNDTPKNKITVKAIETVGIENASSAKYYYAPIASVSGNLFGLSENQYTCVGVSLDRANSSSGDNLSIVPGYALALYNGTDTLLYCSVGGASTTYYTTRYLIWIDYVLDQIGI